MATKNSLAEISGKETLSQFLTRETVQNKLSTAFSDSKEKMRFVSSILSATSVNPKLQNCEFSTIVSASLLANTLSLSLSPQLGYCYLVPFEDKKNSRSVATFILGYKGYLQLAMRTGCYKRMNVIAIKEGEFQSFDRITEELKVSFIEDDIQREKTPTIGYYAYFEYLNGFRKAIYWSKEKMLDHADRYSPAFSLSSVSTPNFSKVSYADYSAGKYSKSDEWKYSSFWYKDFDDMAFKTMLRQLISKWGIVSVEMQTAFENDERAFEEVKTESVVDVEADKVDIFGEEKFFDKGDEK